jgi:tetraacyldisaccharide 4'-kinase
VTIVSVGNLEVGGNGKTPFAMHLVDRLAVDGFRPVYVSRGFKSEAERIAPATVWVPAGVEARSTSAAGVRFVRDNPASLSRTIGDEGAMVAMRCPATPLVFSRHRRRAVEVAIELFQPTHVILDDAFQTWRLHRDIDIVLLDAVSPFGNGRLVPAGSLREQPGALARADAVGLNGYEGAEDLDAFADRVAAVSGKRIPVFGLSRQIELIQANGGGVQDRIDGPAVSLSSIARPGTFDAGLIDRGVDLKLSIRYPDHHRYAAGDLDRVRALIDEQGAAWVVTTEKDWVKLGGTHMPDDRVVLARLTLSLKGLDIPSQIERPRAMPATFD